MMALSHSQKALSTIILLFLPKKSGFIADQEPLASAADASY